MDAIKVAVYRFSLWDPERGENVTAPRAGTREAIELAGGVPEADSMRLVPESDVDGEGFYQPKSVQIPD
jgi:hypothetical protein